MRSQQDLKAKAEIAAAAADAGGAGDNDDDDESTPAVEIDPLDLIDPVEILSKLPKNFYEQIVISSSIIFLLFIYHLGLDTVQCARKR